MTQADPLHLDGPQTQDVAHDVDLEAVKVLVDARPEERLELVGAGLDFVAVPARRVIIIILRIVAPVIGIGTAICGGVGAVFRRAEPQRRGRRVEQTLLD
jgi:hypothetical protein